MKWSAMFAVLSMGATALLGFGCQATDDELDEELLAEDEVESEEQWEAQPLCQDLVVDVVTIKFCGFQNGPLDTSPVTVKCHQTCVTDRYLVLSPPTPGVPGGGFTCATGATTCGPVVCPSCD